MRVGVFGGQFDPPHVGHLVVAQEARYRLRLDRLLIVPSATPPHRPPSRTPAELRYRMALAAFAGEPGTEVTRMELDRPGPSYTVDTLEELAAGGTDELFLVLGADQYRALPRWNGADRIRALATIAVAGRPGHTAAVGDAVPLGSPLVDISSSELRRRLAAGEPVRHLVPDAALALLAGGPDVGGPACYPQRIRAEDPV